jgi:sulfhydrogenase subunit delta
MSVPKPRIAFFDFAGCEGCQLTVIDSLQTDPQLLDAVEIVQFREAASGKDDDYQIAFVEGSCTRPSDEARLYAIRDQAQIVVALGACAHLGGVNAIRNAQRLADAKRYVYGEGGKLIESYAARPIEAVIPIDAFVPGCPIDRKEFLRVVKALLQGRKPAIPDYPLCVECRLKENICVFEQGKTCLGPIIRAGCGALCPTFGTGCEGCRGLISNPNISWLKAVLAERGLDEEDVAYNMRLFLTYQLMESEAAGNGNS